MLTAPPADIFMLECKLQAFKQGVCDRFQVNKFLKSLDDLTDVKVTSL